MSYYQLKIAGLRIVKGDGQGRSGGGKGCMQQLEAEEEVDCTTNYGRGELATVGGRKKLIGVVF